MKKFLLAVFTSLVLLFGGVMFAACGGGGGKTITGVTLNNSPSKTEYLKDETFDISGADLKVSYSDGSNETVVITPEMLGEADTSECGNKQVTVTYMEFTVQVSYTVIFSVSSNEFVKLSAALPALNHATTADIDAVIAAEAAWNALSGEEREYLADCIPKAYSKVNELQRRLLPEYKEEADARVNDYFGYINAGNYTEEAYAQITGYVQAFLTGEFTTLAAVKEGEETLYVNIEAVEKKTDGEDFDLEEYRESTIASLLTGMKGTIYRVESGALVSEEKNYAEADEYKARVEELLAPLKNATDAHGIDKGYKDAANALRGIYVQAFAKDAEESLGALVTAWRAVENEKFGAWGKDTVSLRGQFDDLPLDYAQDNRWWIPMPYRIPTLLEAAPAKLASAKTADEINAYYESFAYEILRAAMQRNLELVYAIERNMNSAYDTGDGLYWNNIADYWGASATTQFVYDGILDAYKGEIYGSSDSNPYRFSGMLYRDGGPASIEELPAAYARVINNIFVKITGTEITVQPKTEYEAGEAFTVAGGEITVSYSNGTSDKIAMTSEMYNAADVNMTPGGSYSVTLTFTARGEQKTVVINYTVAARKVTAVRITTLPASTFVVGGTFTVEGGVITVTFNDNTAETVAMTDEMYAKADVDLATAGNKVITLTFTVNGSEQTVDFNYTVLEPEAKRVESVTIATMPDKTEYELGETLSLTGGSILVTYSDTTTETLTMSSEMIDETAVDTSEAGEKEITLTFTVNDETQTLQLPYTVLRNEDFEAFLEKATALPEAQSVTAENLAAAKECYALWNRLNENAKNVIETKHAGLLTKFNAVQSALVAEYVKPDSAAFKDAYDYLNRFAYEDASLAALDEGYAAYLAALDTVKTFAEADAAIAACREAFDGMTEKSQTVAEFAENSAASARKIAERVVIGNLYQVSAAGYAQLAIALQEAQFADTEAVNTKISEFQNALSGMETLDAAKTEYETKIRALFDNDLLLEAYREAAEANVKGLVDAMRNTVKQIWEKDGFAGDDTIAVDYMQNVEQYLWWTPVPMMVSTLVEKLTVKSATTMEEQFANYEAAYIEMLRAVMYRNLFTVLQYNVRSKPELDGIRWQSLAAIHNESFPELTYTGLLEEYQGQLLTELSPAKPQYRLWYWGYHPTEKSVALGDLVWHYNADMATYLLPAQTQQTTIQ